MNPFEKSRWIWWTIKENCDEYGEFVQTFLAPEGRGEILLSCDGDYALWVNGTFAASNQYGDFEHYKIYDTVNLTPYLTEGENRIALLVWHFGTASQRYFPGKAGVIFEIRNGTDLLAVSSDSVLSRKSPAYKSHGNKSITGQLGLSFSYNADKEDSWRRESVPGFSPAVPVEKYCTFHPRPIEKLQLLPTVWGKEIRREENRILFDLGREIVGLISLTFTDETKQELVLSWGEHLDENGWVPRIMGGRDFSIEYGTKTGLNEYFNPMLRVAGQYLEVSSPFPLKNLRVGILPQVYPKRHKEAKFLSETDAKIYEICVNCLDLCMMEHYVDSPWREQCLYAFDSRNQMLCGYEVYEDGNAAYARANLKLFAQDRRNDGLLSICTPCGSDLTIPSFSLHYIIAVDEYLQATGDKTLIDEVYPKLESLLDTFMKHRENGLVLRFPGKSHWNFYDWSDYCYGHLRSDDRPEPDAALNCLTVLALKAMKHICEFCALPFPYSDEISKISRKTKEVFFIPEKGLLSLREETEEYAELATTLAILAEILTDEEAKTALNRIVNGETRPCSLSMRVFKYDAMIKTDKETYLPVILEEIRRDYGKMLKKGAQCTWETLLGPADFDGAGSLCHGWSALPVRYLPKTK